MKIAGCREWMDILPGQCKQLMFFYYVVIEVGRLAELLEVTTYSVHYSCWLGRMCSRLGVCHWFRIQLGSMLLDCCG